MQILGAGIVDNSGRVHFPSVAGDPHISFRLCGCIPPVGDCSIVGNLSKIKGMLVLHVLSFETGVFPYRLIASGVSSGGKIADCGYSCNLSGAFFGDVLFLDSEYIHVHSSTAAQAFSSEVEQPSVEEDQKVDGKTKATESNESAEKVEPVVSEHKEKPVDDTKNGEGGPNVPLLDPVAFTLVSQDGLSFPIKKSDSYVLSPKPKAGKGVLRKILQDDLNLDAPPKKDNIISKEDVEYY